MYSSQLMYILIIQCSFINLQMNLEEIKKRNPFILTTLTQKIRNHLQNKRNCDQNVQNANHQNNFKNCGKEVETNRSNSAQKQSLQYDLNYNAISNMVMNPFTTKFENQNVEQIIIKPQQRHTKPEKTQAEQQNLSNEQQENHNFFIKSINQALFLKNKYKAKQVNQENQTKQISNNIQNLLYNKNTEIQQQVLANYEKAAKKPIQIIEIKSDSDQRANDQINLKQSAQVNKKKNPVGKKIQPTKGQQKMKAIKAISKDMNILSKLGNKYPNININQIRHKIFKNYNTNKEPIQQNKQKLIRPQIQIKMPFRKQSNLLKDNEYRESYNQQNENQTHDQQKAVNRYNEQMVKRSKILSQREISSKNILQSQEFTDFYIHINLLNDKQVDIAKINQTNKQITNSTINFKPTIPKQSPITSVNDKYRQQRISNYFLAKDKKDLVSKINNQIDKKITQDKKNVLKQNHNAKKSSKHMITYPQNQLKLQNIDYEEFIHRRIKKKGQPTDLGVLTIDQIVQQCYIKGLIGEQMYVQYINQSSREKIKEFIHYFIDRRLNQWNFQEIKITLMDHRRLAQLLVNLFPKDYILYQPHSIQKDIHDFLNNLYLLSSSDYKSLLDSLDHISGVIFWKTFKIKYQKYINMPVKIIPFPPNNIQKIPTNKVVQQGKSFAIKTQQQMLTASQKELIQKYKQEIVNKSNNLKRPNNYVNDLSEYSSDQSSDLSPEFNKKYGKQVKKLGKKTIKNRKRIH